METIREFYDLVKTFWIDVYRAAVKGTETHLKAIKISLLFCAALFIILGGIFLRFTESSTFCGVCHQMNAYMESWRTSSHKQVACTKCHYEPGLINHLKGKWVDGQVSLAYFLSGKRPSAPHAQISDASCLQKGCHKIEDLKGNMVYKNVAFSHGKHLGELKRGMNLRCTSCHAQLVQGKHLTVHEINCFICHYYKAGPKGEEDCISCAIGGCTSCHVEPKGDIKVKGWSFNHRKYIARGVACEKCHLSVVQGDGHVPEGKCLECHNEPVILSTKYRPEFMHQKHVTDHKIECSNCHTPLRHEIGQIPTMAQIPSNCDKCHNKDMHLGPRDFYRGTGGIGVPESPSLMLTTNVDCIACHRKAEEGKAALHRTRYADRVIGEACVDCHGEGFDETLKQWKSLLSKAENETNQRIFDAQKRLYEFEKANGNAPGFKKAQNLLNEARHNYSFVLLGKGVHNVEYAFKLLNAANNRTEQVLGIVNKGYQPRDFKTSMTCTTLCHVGIEKRAVPFNETKFSHQTHIAGKGQKCSDCHSPRENHGKTILKNCAGCHHGNETKKVKCQDCHAPIQKIIQGKGGIGVQERPSSKLDVVECVDCHRSVGAKRKGSFDSIKKRCIECHDQSYGEMVIRWKATSEDSLRNIEPKLKKVKEEIERIELSGGHTFVFRKLYGDAEFNYNLAKNGKGVHNLDYAEELLEVANNRLDDAIRQIDRRKELVSKGRM
ncbi:MAG TPA: cytochrome c3 family protein [Thermodesulfobacteriota bacterium]|nr:cytochrome c3 family protein [Thermodesulfobacteriota bacterium]